MPAHTPEAEFLHDRNWPSRASRLLNLFARNLTLDPLSNWVTALLPVAGANLVPQAVSGESQDRPFADIARGAKADLQSASSFPLTWLAPVQRKESFASARIPAAQLP